MKKILLILLTIPLLFSCKDDELESFDVDLSTLDVSFTPYEGGAYMNYTLPPNADIYGIQAKYKDWTGKEMLVKGTHANNQLDLFGFNEAASNIPVAITLIDHKGNHSEQVNKTFATLSSSSFSIFDELEVAPHWNGFRVTYPELDSHIEGFMNIYFVGKDPVSKEIDTIRTTTLPLMKDGYNYMYTDIQEEDNTGQVTVVVKTEDNRGNIMRTQVFENIEVSMSTKFPSDQIGFEGSSVEGGSEIYGSEFLFDGLLRGERCLEGNDDRKYYVYKSEPGAEFDSTTNVITLDLQDAKEIAWIRIYSQLCAKLPSSRTPNQIFRMRLHLQFYYPSHVILYGANDKDAPETEWVYLSEYYEHPQIDQTSRWSFPGFDPENYYTNDELEKFKAQDPNYIQLNVNITGNQYRYVKVRVKETHFTQMESGSLTGYTGEFTMEELEVYVKKEND